MPSYSPINFSQPLKNVLISRQSRARPAQAVSESKIKEDQEALEAKNRAKQEKALADAYQKGLAEGQQQAAEEAKKQFNSLEKAVKTTLQSLDAEKENLSAELEGILPELIVEGVGRVLYNLKPDGDTIRQIVMEILEGFDTEDSKLRLVMHPGDIEALRSVDSSIDETYPGLKFIGNDTLHPGECYLEGRFGLSDARYSAKLASLRKVLE